MARRRPTDDQHHAAWVADYKVLKGDVLNMHLHRQMFEELDDALVADQSQSASIWCEDFLRPLYIQAQGVTLRRLIDANTETVSFVRLLTLMSECPRVLSRARYLADVDPQDTDRIRFADADFDRLAGAGEPFIPRDRILALREAIETEIRAVADHVSQWIAHRDREAKAPITWGELHNAVDRIGERLGEVSVMLTGGFQMPKPTIQFDWKDVMRRGVFHRPLREWTEWDIRFSRSFT